MTVAVVSSAGQATFRIEGADQLYLFANNTLRGAGVYEFDADRIYDTKGNLRTMVQQVGASNLTTVATYSIPTGSYGNISGTEVTIFPRTRDSRIILQWMLNYEADNNIMLGIMRNGVLINPGGTGVNSSQWGGATRYASYVVGDHDRDIASTPSNFVVQFHDYPSTVDGVTYSLAATSSTTSAFTFYLNRSVNSAGQDDYEVARSMVTWWDITG